MILPFIPPTDGQAKIKKRAFRIWKSSARERVHSGAKPSMDRIRGLGALAQGQTAQTAPRRDPTGVVCRGNFGGSFDRLCGCQRIS